MRKFLIIGSFGERILEFRGDFFQELNKSDIEVNIAIPLSSTPKKTIDIFKENGYKVHNFSLKKAQFSFFSDLVSFFEILYLVIKIRPSDVFSYTMKPICYGSIAAKICGVKNISAMFTGLGHLYISNEKKQSLQIKIAKSLLKFSLGMNKRVIFHNSDDLQVLKKQKIILSSHKTLVINGSGVNMQRFSFNEANVKKIIFLFCGRFIKEKGILDFCKTAKKVKEIYPSATFIIAGNFDDNPSTLKQSDLAYYIENKYIENLGYVEDIATLIDKCSVFILPSYREGMPRSTLEAMASGRAIITTNVPGCKETVINGQNGFLVEKKDVNAMVKKCLYFFENKDEIIKMGIESRKIVQKKFCSKQVAVEMRRFLL